MRASRVVRLAAIFTLACATYGQIIISTSLGDVNGTGVAYLGLPYARPAQRWAAAEAPEPWAPALLQATAFAPACMQLDVDGQNLFPPSRESEDCLYLNVFKPFLATPGANLPVAVLLTASDFAWGAPDAHTASGANFANAQNIVVVTVSYRVGVFGFLPHPSAANLGLQDTTLALKWVQQHIYAFGGDNQTVALVGQSSGAVIACLQLSLPESVGLFHRVILQSGFCPVLGLPTEETPAQAFADFATRANCSDLACLQSRSTADLQKAAKKSSKVRSALGLYTDGTIVPANWTDVFSNSSGTFSKVPVLVGTNKNEMGLKIANSGVKFTWELVAGYLQQIYPNNASIFSTFYNLNAFETPIETVMALTTANSFTCYSRWTKVALARSMPVYSYLFDVAPSWTPAEWGAYTGAEVPYIWLNPFTPWTQEEISFASTISSVWSQFIRNGSVAQQNWAPFSLQAQTYAVLDLESQSAVNLTVKQGDHRLECDVFDLVEVAPAFVLGPTPDPLSYEPICKQLFANPIPIWRLQNETNSTCASGFHCPNINVSDSATWAQACPPTPECLGSRLYGQQCERQGKYEPILCYAGFYCPDSTRLLKCPSGYFCPRGSPQPLECGIFSICDEGSTSERNLLGIVILVIVDAVIGGGIVIYRVRARRKSNRWVKVHPDDGHVETGPKGGDSELQELNGNVVDAMASKEGEANAEVLCEGFARARGREAPMDFDFSNLSLTLPNKKQILQNVTGTIEHGQVTAILGASGAGKTTFLHTLMGKVDPSWKRGGKLKINGVTKSMDAYKGLIGYVPQEDIMHRELTVWQNLLFSANVRLPSDWTSEDRQTHVEACLNALNLENVKYTAIGDERTRGVSGGQRKRTNIGMELASAPLALFLDEPTSGLDATSAKEVCMMLRRIAKDTGITVAMVIHQPRLEIWNALDQIIVLAPGGLTVYQGPQRLCQRYFEKFLGVKFEITDNPPDRLMDAIAVQGPRFASEWSTQGLANLATLQSPDSPKSKAQAGLAQSTEDGSLEKSSDQLLANESSSRTKLGDRFGNIAVDRGANFVRQIWLCHARSLKKQVTVLWSLLLEVFLATAAGVLLGMALPGFYRSVYKSPYTLISPQSEETYVPQKMLYIHMAIGLAASSAGVRVFGEEIPIFWREAASGHNRLAYFIGVSTASLYRIILAGLHFSALFTVLSRQMVPYSEFFLVTTLVFFCVYGLASVVSMIVPREDAPLLAVVTSLVVAVMNGYTDAFPKELQYMGYSVWSSEALFGKELLPFGHLYRIDASADIFDYKMDRFVTDVVVIAAIGVIYRIVAFILLLVRNREKQR